MDTPVLKLWLANPVIDAFELPQERIDAYFEKDAQIMQELGIRTLLEGEIWSEEHYTGFGVQWFPSWKALREHQRCQDAEHWMQYMHADVYVALEHPDFPVSLAPLDLDPSVDWITHIFVARHTEAWYGASEETRAGLMQTQEQNETLGSRFVMVGYTRPVQEEWEAWGLELYPSMEALKQSALAMEKVDWWRYFEARTFLGTLKNGDLLKK